MTDEANFTDSLRNYDMPARKAILQYLVRMGSFTSAPKIPNEDKGDEDVEFPAPSTWQELRGRCDQQLSGVSSGISRDMLCVGTSSETNTIRIMQWNILAQALAEGSDKFVRCPSGALTWQSRRWKILAEVAAVEPDILCLQEVDHFKFFEKALTSVGLVGMFCPKPDSPCLYIPDNNGPDGCALFINTLRYEVLDTKNRCLEAWGCQSNQVAILCKLKRRSDESEFWVVTTHLKARCGTFPATLRREQGCDLLDFVRSNAGESAPLLLAGDLNAEPTEPIHSILRSSGLVSAYSSQTPAYTTWTVREDGEYAKTLDYVLFRARSFHVHSILNIPTEENIGEERVPSFKYPSDHFALVTDMVLHDF